MMLKTAILMMFIAASSLGPNATLGQTAIPPSPQDFVTSALQCDYYEIQAARVAKVEGRNALVLTFAETMISDHTKTSLELQKAAVAAGLTPPTGVSTEQAEMLGGLQSVHGVDFDRAYARQQVLAHTQASAVEQSFASGGANVDLRKAAQSALPMIRDHLRKAKQLHDQIASGS